MIKETSCGNCWQNSEELSTPSLSPLQLMILGMFFHILSLFPLYPMLWLLQQLRAIISKATIYLHLFYLCIVSSFSFKSYSPTPKNLPTRNWHLKMTLSATAEGSLGKRDGCLKPSYSDREQNSNNKPKVRKTSGGWTKRVILKI